MPTFIVAIHPEVVDPGIELFIALVFIRLS